MACCSLIVAENCALKLTTLAERTPKCMPTDWAFFRYTSTSRSTTFSQLENADWSGGIGTILVSLSSVGLISASVSRLTEQELAIAVVTGTDSGSTLACRARRDGGGGGDDDAVTVRAATVLSVSSCSRDGFSCNEAGSGLGHWRCAMWRMSNVEAAVFLLIVAAIEALAVYAAW